MITKNNISIFRKFKVSPIIDYCIQFNRNGYISIDSLTPFLDHNIDFCFEMQFKIYSFPSSGFNYLMNSCFDKTENKIGIAIDRQNLYVQVDKGIIGKTEFSIPFYDNKFWHSISIVNNYGSLSAILDLNLLPINLTPVLSLPLSLGFRIASDSANLQNLYGFVDNILITDTSRPISNYLLNEGSGSIAYDSVGDNNGTITNGQWALL